MLFNNQGNFILNRTVTKRSYVILLAIYHTDDDRIANLEKVSIQEIGNISTDVKVITNLVNIEAVSINLID